MLQDYFGFDIRPYTTDAFYSAGEVINPEGSMVETLIFLKNGTAKCTETQENGIVNLIAYLTGPSFIGDLELVGARTWSSGITAVTDCACSIIHLRECRDQILNDVRFLQYLSYNFACKAVRNGKNMTMGKSYPLKNRLATFLLDMQNNGLYTIPHTEASSYLGVSYRHLLYVLAQLQDDGFITKTHAGFRLNDKKGLEELYIHQPD